jgi:outer membrane receptor protein involved in Fe transport
MYNNSKVAKAIRLAMMFGAGAAASIAAPAFAAEEEGAEDVERIEVTGSRIKRTDLETASPVTIISREEMEISGLTDVGAFLQSIPSMSGSPIGTTTNNGGSGAVLVDLRGMGSSRTLTLVNGRRVVDAGDYQAIPSSMIQSVEILKDGASAIYGADAVAGVVNIITRSDFTGVEVTAQTSDWSDTNGAGQNSFSVIAGREFDTGNFVFGAEFVDQTEAFQRDTPWDFMQNSFYIYPGGCEAQVAAPYDGTPQGGCYPVGSSRIPESRLPFYSQGLFLVGTPATTPNEVGLMVPHDGRTYNYAPVNYLQTPYERVNIFGEAKFELTDKINFTAEFRGNQRSSAQQLAPLPFTGGDPMYNGFYDDPSIDADTGLPVGTVSFTGVSQDNYYLRRAVDTYNEANGTSLVYEPVVNPRRRMIETNRRFEQEVTQYQWGMGFDGEINDDLSWDVYLNQGHRSTISRDFGQFAGSRLSNALGPSADLDNDGAPECYADINNPATVIQGCVPLNLFGGGVVDAGGNPTVTTLTQEMLDYVSLDTVDAITEDQTTLSANLTGVGFELPGGEFGWSVGYSFWKQELANILDSAKTIGAVTGNVGASTVGSLTNNAAYGEFYAPVFDNGTQSVGLKGGLRYDDWDQFGSGTTYQFGIELSLLDDLKLRTTYGTVFRAPTINDLFGGVVDSFPTYNDPCDPADGSAPAAGCAQRGNQTDSQVNAKVGGNPFLEPEEGETFTAGVVWSPEFGEHNFTVIADYWNINLDSGINSLGVQFTLDECYVEQNENACALVTRNSDYTINNVLDTQLNVSSETAAGIDMEFKWNYSTNIGSFNSSVLWTRLLEREQIQFEGADPFDYVGQYAGAAFAEDKANISFQWTLDDFSVGYLGEYISGLETDDAFGVGYTQKIDAQMYHDIVASYTFSAESNNVVISAGVTNITNEAPPFIDTGFNGKTDPSTYRMFGQGYYLRLKWSFE